MLMYINLFGWRDWSLIDYSYVESLIVNGLQKYLSANGDTQCHVVMANQASPLPQYPYVSYTITTITQTKRGTYGFFSDGKHYKQMNQIWSFTVQSNNQIQSSNIAIMAYDYFNHHGLTYLTDNNVAVVRITNITNRDNFITAEYEYRQGFDVTFGIMHQITPSIDEQLEIIKIGKITAIIDDEEKEINF